MLDYFALFMLLFVAVTLVFGIVAIHDIPHVISKSRQHPHQDAIHAAGWVSLFTLHALWPLLWIWAMAYRADRGWGFATTTDGSPGELPATIARLEARLTALEEAQRPSGAVPPAVRD